MMRSMLRAAALTVLALAGASGCRLNQELPQLPTAASVPPGQEAELTMRWFGTSTVSISDGPTTIMIDGFFSRPRMRTLAFAWLGLPLVRSDQASIDAGLAPLGDETIEAIFVAHAHHDHALDTGRVARRDNARVYGSVSVAYIVDQELDGATVEPIWDGFSTTIGAFEVRAIASPHKPSAFGPAGDITQPLPLPANLRAFRSGPSFSFLITHPRGTVLVMPSPVIDGAPPTLEGQSADVVLLGIGLLGRESEATMHSYWKSVVCLTGATQVHPIHWDDFMRPLEERLVPLRFDRMARSIDILGAFAEADEIKFSYLPLFKKVPIRQPRTRRTQYGFCRCSLEPGATSLPEPANQVSAPATASG